MREKIPVLGYFMFWHTVTEKISLSLSTNAISLSLCYLSILVYTTVVYYIFLGPAVFLKRADFLLSKTPLQLFIIIDGPPRLF